MLHIVVKPKIYAAATLLFSGGMNQKSHGGNVGRFSTSTVEYIYPPAVLRNKIVEASAPNETYPD